MELKPNIVIKVNLKLYTIYNPKMTKSVHLPEFSSEHGLIS